MPPIPSQLTLVQSQVGPGIVSGPGQTAFGGVSESSLPVVPFMLPLTVNQTAIMVYDGASELDLALAASGHTNDTLFIYIPHNTATALTVAALMMTEGDGIINAGGVVTDFNPEVNYVLSVSAFKGATTDQGFASTLRSLGRPTGIAPSILSASIPSAAPTTLVVVFPTEMYLAAVDPALTLAFTSGPARTITSLISGNGTTTLTFGLSGAVGPTAVGSLNVAASRVLQAMNGPLVDVGTTPLSIAWALTNETHMWRGDGMSLTGPNVDTIADPVGGVTWTTPAGSPQLVTGIGGSTRNGWKTVAGSYLTGDSAAPEVMTSFTLYGVMLVPTHGAGKAFFGTGQAAALGTNEIDFIDDTVNYNLLRNFAQVGTVSTSSAGAALFDFMAVSSPTGASLYINGVLVASNATAAVTANIGRWICGVLADFITFPAVDVEFGELRASNAVSTLTDAVNGHNWRLSYYA